MSEELRLPPQHVVPPCFALPTDPAVQICHAPFSSFVHHADNGTRVTVHVTMPERRAEENVSAEGGRKEEVAVAAEGRQQ